MIPPTGDCTRSLLKADTTFHNDISATTCTTTGHIYQIGTTYIFLKHRRTHPHPSAQPRSRAAESRTCYHIPLTTCELTGHIHQVGAKTSVHRCTHLPSLVCMLTLSSLAPTLSKNQTPFEHPTSPPLPFPPSPSSARPYPPPLRGEAPPSRDHLRTQRCTAASFHTAARAPVSVFGRCNLPRSRLRAPLCVRGPMINR